MTRFLYVEDDLMDLRLMLYRFEHLKNLEIHWLPNAVHLAEYLGERKKDFDMIVVDYRGTSLSKGVTDIVKSIRGQNIIVTSAARIPHENGITFVPKEYLRGYIERFLNER